MLVYDSDNDVFYIIDIHKNNNLVTRNHKIDVNSLLPCFAVLAPMLFSGSS